MAQHHLHCIAKAANQEAAQRMRCERSSMFTDTINKCAANAGRIARLSANHPLSFWVSSMMAGAYVGLGIILIFTLGNLLDLPFARW